ncbi:MAG TPA: hypothetical protein VK151_04390 [Fluviicola sp.]|nr:hypothetical protein [Fluviicola sp.]
MGALKFRVLLDSEKEQETFRDILINDTDNFETLYRAILNAFRFEGQEIGSFYMSNDDWDKGHEIGLMDMRYSDEDESLPSVMKDAVLKDFMEVPDQKIILVYDFLRMWIFLIELLEQTEQTVDKPEVVLSIGVAPPEDSKMIPEDDDFMGEGEEDELFGEDDEFDDGYDEEDYSNYDEFNY